jgi:SSS family solute:Na+ symporter
MHLTSSDYVVIVGYFVLISGVGLWVKRTQATASDYFAGGHQIPWWMAGISHYMSGFSAFSFVVYSQMAYVYGWVAITLFWTGVPACVCGGLVFARRWRRARVITPIEFLEERCNSKVRQLFVWIGIPSKLFDDALKIFATSLFLAVSVGLPLRMSLMLCVLIVLGYTLSGGLFALVVADYVQFLMKALAIILLFPLAVLKANTLRNPFAGIPSSLFKWTASPYNWVYVIGYAVVVLISYNGSWALAQKYYSVPDERSAAKAAYLSAALTFVGTPVMFLPAILARRFLPNLIAQGRTEDVYVLMLLKLLPVGMIGIIVAAMFSATMAAVSSDLNAIASVLTKDWYQRMWNQGASEKTLLQAGRWFTLSLGVIIFGLSMWLANSHSGSLFQLMVTVLGVLVAPTILPILVLLISKSVSSTGVICGLVCGLSIGIASISIKELLLVHMQLSENALLTSEGVGILANVGGTLLGMYIGSRIWPASAEEAERTKRFLEKMNVPVQRGEVKGKADIAHPSRLIGFATLIVGALLVIAGSISGARVARVVDLGCGGGLAIMGSLLMMRKREKYKNAVARMVGGR